METNALIEAFQAEFVSWGIKRMTMLDLRLLPMYKNGQYG